MRVLVLSAGGIYLKRNFKAKKSNSGFAHIIYDIAKILWEEGFEVDVLSQSIFTTEINVEDGFRIVKKKWKHILCSISPFYLLRALRVIRVSDASMSFKLRILLYFLTGSYVEKVIKKRKIDIVHIHGITEGSLPYLYACAKTKTPYVITLHGLISFNNMTRATNFARSLERTFLKASIESKFKMSVVSTGVKDRVSNWLINDCNNIHVICNPVKSPIIESRNETDKANTKSILCVGNIYPQKNQIFIIKGFAMLKKKYGINASLTFIGDGPQKEELERYAKENSLNEVFFTGLVGREKVYNYYLNADLLVTASIDEGFGLPIIEAYSYGVPALAFDDIDAIKDIYSPDCMVLVRERTLEALAENMKLALDIKWNKNKIQEFSKKFSMSAIGKTYKKLLDHSLDNILSEDNVDQILEDTIRDISLWKTNIDSSIIK